jgi:lysophospholipase L1-like esterase
MLKGTENRRVIVMSVAPMAEWVARAAERNLVVAEVNERLAAAAPSNGFTFVDLDPVLSDGLGYLRGDMTSDGVHLGAAAYRGIVEKLEEAALKR